jgi:hypothetical protein
VRVVECTGDSANDFNCLIARKSCPIVLAQQLRGIHAVYVIHRKPELAVVFAPVVHAHDMRMPKRRRHVGFAVEAAAVLGISRHICRKYLQRIATRQPRMLRQIDLAHAPEPSKHTIVKPAKIAPSLNGMSGCPISQSVSHRGVPPGRRNCVEGERRGKPHQGRAGDRQVLAASPVRASRRAGPDRRPRRPRCRGVCRGAR